MRNPRPPQTREARALTLAGIIPYLHNARRLRDGEWIASCPLPSHGRGRGDLNPSLSISESPDGELLVHCHAGCDSREILRELRRLAGLDRPNPRRSERPASRETVTEPEPREQDQFAFVGCSLEQLARDKMLDPDLLRREWRVADRTYAGV
ncbi:MAG: hypothetical protein P3X24_007425, partial [bacterium]|nr:hypothetical protein [bacterium]